MMRQKQKPFFSTLEAVELDISDLEEKKAGLLPEEALSEIVSDPIKVLPPVSVVTPPLPDLSLTSEISISAREFQKGALPSEETPTESVPEAIEVQPSAVVVASSLLDLSQTSAISVASLEAEKVVPLAKVTLPEPQPDTIQVRPSAAVVAEPLLDPPRKTGNRICDAAFVYIAPGTFIMGSPEHEPGRVSDETLHEVTLTRGYSIQATPVTQGQWKDEMGSNPSGFPQGGQDCPVERVSWNDCQEFIRKLNKKGEYSYRLPTEAEWEYACRAGAGTSFFNGEITKKLFWRRDPCLDAIGWYCGNSGKKTHPVAEKKPNAWGLFDLHGNVCEWCQDWYGKFAARPQADPSGAAFGSGCVVRGGSWSSESRNCRSASRLSLAPNLRSDCVGFRLVRES